MSSPRWAERISIAPRMGLISIKIATLRLAGLLARDKISTCIMIAGMILLPAAMDAAARKIDAEEQRLTVQPHALTDARILDNSQPSAPRATTSLSKRL